MLVRTVAVCCAVLSVLACSPADDLVATDAGDGRTDTAADELPDRYPDYEVGEADALVLDDPVSCAEAAEAHMYVGCDFWPTVLPNVVGKHFDYAVVVSNAGAVPAAVTIERGGEVAAEGEVPAMGLTKFFLPWVDELKHWTGMCDTDMVPTPDFASTRVPDGAYHLTSSVPVTVFQFNPLEYGPEGGPEGKDWEPCRGCLFGCHSYTNDASLLLPATSATGNYRIMAPAGQDTEDVHQPGYFAVTGTADGTTVRAQLGRGGAVTGGADIPAAGPGDVFEFALGRGEVVVIVGTNTTDLSGTVLNADRPILVLSGAPCIYMPDSCGACDHLEESVFPAETLGRRYVVTVPTNPRGVPIGHVVRLYGNVDGTTLEYPAGVPDGAPATLDAGQVADLGVVRVDFEVSSPDHEFGVTSFQLGSCMADPGHFTDSRGDPAQSNVQAVEQYRKKYVFLAPDDYDFSFADIVLPDFATVLLDGNVPREAPLPIGDGFGVVRVPLERYFGGAHVLEADEPVGLQVMGYGFATSYQYPGGLNLLRIAEPPIIL
ncbi:MAG: IgGFc-binding protein [Deltaproteobacteria bacterium]|nr:IgGFc-binding protein [Deltaproteobacteria bacterium]